MKTKNSRVPKSGKTRLSDLTPKKDARGGRFATPPGGGNAGPGVTPPGVVQPKKSSNRPVGGPATA